MQVYGNSVYGGRKSSACFEIIELSSGSKTSWDLTMYKFFSSPLDNISTISITEFLPPMNLWNCIEDRILFFFVLPAYINEMQNCITFYNWRLSWFTTFLGGSSFSPATHSHCTRVQHPMKLGISKTKIMVEKR